MPKFDIYENITNRIIAMLEQGVRPWACPWMKVQNSAISHATGKRYSLLNHFLLADEKKKYATLEEVLADVRGEYATFHQITESGGKVKKGEHGKQIVFFKWIQKTDEAKNPVVDEKGKPVMFPMLTSYTVFKIGVQTEGIEPKHITEIKMNSEISADSAAEAVAADYLTRSGVEYRKVAGSKAYYSPMEDLVVTPLMEQFKSVAEYYSTLFHEFTHSTGHPKRLARIKTEARFGDCDYSLEELVAEIGSATICASLGLDTNDSMENSAAYIGGWLKALKGDKKMIVTAAARAEKAVNMILNREGV